MFVIDDKILGILTKLIKLYVILKISKSKSLASIYYFPKIKLEFRMRHQKASSSRFSSESNLATPVILMMVLNIIGLVWC